MLPKEIIKKIRRIEITTSRLVSDVFAGQYHSVFKGQGMEFEEVREYLPGDEIRSIDWNVTARMGHPFVKKFVEERQLTVMLLLDVSGSNYFGSGRQLKSEIAAELCSVLAFSAIRNNDRVGLLVFSDRIETFIPPRKGTRHVLRVIREALYAKPQGRKTDIQLALRYLNSVLRKKAVCFVLSDFWGCEYRRQLRVANKRHDMIAVTITDPRERELPAGGLVFMEDGETGAPLLVDTNAPGVRAAFQQHSRTRIKERAMTLRQTGIDTVDIQTDVPYSAALYRFFRMRERRIRR